VQWHPERSGDGPVGSGLFEQLIAAALRHHSATEGASHAAS
jgi:hypothetical protein